VLLGEIVPARLRTWLGEISLREGLMTLLGKKMGRLQAADTAKVAMGI
jgi:hypothetical protein